jgi:hypothetical protein
MNKVINALFITIIIENYDTIKGKLMYEWKNLYRMLNARAKEGLDETVTRKQFEECL